MGAPLRRGAVRGCKRTRLAAHNMQDAPRTTPMITHMLRIDSLRQLAAPALVAMIFVAGCGGDSDGDTAAATTTLRDTAASAPSNGDDICNAAALSTVVIAVPQGDGGNSP